MRSFVTRDNSLNKKIPLQISSSSLHCFFTWLNILLCLVTGIKLLTVSRCLVSAACNCCRYSSFPFAARAPHDNNMSVIPPKADTTTMVLSLFIFSCTIETTLSIFSAVATELPPNFNTCIPNNL